LLSNDVLESRPGHEHEDSVVERQEGEVLPARGREARADAADDDRDRERQEEQRQQQLARAPGSSHRGKHGPDRADSDIRQRDADEAQHRRQRVPRPQLEQQLLSRKGARVRQLTPHTSDSLPVAKRSSRSGAWLATSSVRSRRSSSSSRSSNSSPASSSALAG